MSVSDWSWLLGVNVWAAIHGSKSLLPLLNANPDGGHLIITASVAGLHITPGLGGCTVSKFALVALVALAETLALELAQSGSMRMSLSIRWSERSSGATFMYSRIPGWLPPCTTGAEGSPQPFRIQPGIGTGRRRVPQAV